MSEGHDTGERAWHASLQGLVFALTGFLGSYTVADPDLWGHIRFGLDTLQAGAVVRTDPYSYLSGGQPWINHEWLSELLMALAWDRLGPPGLVALKVAVIWAMVGGHPVPPPPPPPAAGGRRHRHHHGLVAHPAMDDRIPAPDLHLPGKRHRAQPRGAGRGWRLRRALVGCPAIGRLGEPPRRVHCRHRPVRDLGSDSCGQSRVVVRVAAPGGAVCGQGSRPSPAGGDSGHRDYALRSDSCGSSSGRHWSRAPKSPSGIPSP